MRSYILPVLPVALVAFALFLSTAPNATGPVKTDAASDLEYQILHQRAVSALEGLRREVDPRIVAAQFAR